MKCLTHDLEVPASAEIVLEGHLRPDASDPTGYETAAEGPFGDHTGYYNEVERFPVFTIERITLRRDPIYHSTYTGKPPDEPSMLGLALNEVFVPLLQKQFPEIADFYLPPEGCSYRMAVVSMKKQYPGHAKRVMFGVWSFLRQFMYTKFIVVTDDDVDVRDWKEVIWAITTRVDPVRDTLLVPSTPIDYLDFASPVAGLGGKMGLDATNKWPGETDARVGAADRDGRRGRRARRRGAARPRPMTDGATVAPHRGEPARHPLDGRQDERQRRRRGGRRVAQLERREERIVAEASDAASAPACAPAPTSSRRLLESACASIGRGRRASTSYAGCDAVSGRQSTPAAMRPSFLIATFATNWSTLRIGTCAIATRTRRAARVRARASSSGRGARARRSGCRFASDRVRVVREMAADDDLVSTDGARRRARARRAARARMSRGGARERPARR